MRHRIVSDNGEKYMEEQTNDPHSDISEPKDALPPVSLTDLPQVMQEAVSRAGWTELTPVQERAIPYLQAKRDLMVQARTGKYDRPAPTGQAPQPRREYLRQ